MRFTRLILENWRNFLNVDVTLQKRVFLVGPNASGKSNLLDAFRFLRDIADIQGGFQRAVQERQGVSKLRSLHARRYPNIVVQAEMFIDSKNWSYRLEFTQDNNRRPVIRKETVLCGEKFILSRPNDADRADEELLTQTHLEQINANRGFREIGDFLRELRYLHIVPQLIRDPNRSIGKTRDPFGGDFLEQMMRTPKKTLDSRLGRIKNGLRIAVPNLDSLELKRDEKGITHLIGGYSHWRPNAARQAEDQFSDGTLRLVGLLWSFLDGTAPLLLEEPELSLHAAIVRRLPGIIANLTRKSGRQVMLSTHSSDLLSDEGIDGGEVLLLHPAREATEVSVASHSLEIRRQLESGLTIADVMLPRTSPPNVRQLSLFGEPA